LLTCSLCIYTRNITARVVGRVIEAVVRGRNWCGVRSGGISFLFRRRIQKIRTCFVFVFEEPHFDLKIEDVLEAADLIIHCRLYHEVDISMMSEFLECG
jgi:hypothetical protein